MIFYWKLSSKDVFKLSVSIILSPLVDKAKIPKSYHSIEIMGEFSKAEKEV